MNKYILGHQTVFKLDASGSVDPSDTVMKYHWHCAEVDTATADTFTNGGLDPTTLNTASEYHPHTPSQTTVRRWADVGFFICTPNIGHPTLSQRWIQRKNSDDLSKTAVFC